MTFTIHTPIPNIKPEDIKLEDLSAMSKDSFPMWALSSGVQMDNNYIDFNHHRYLLPIYADQRDFIVWQKAAQLGATSYMLLRAIWWLLQNQGRKAGLYFPTKDGVELLSQDRVDPLLRSVPDVWKLVQESEKQSSRMALKHIGKSSFYLLHLGGSASKDSTPLDFITFDEVRLCDPQDIDQALERISHSPYKVKVMMSTCHAGNTTVYVRDKATQLVSTKSLRDLQTCYPQYEVLSYNRLGGYRPRWRDIQAVHNNGVKPVVRATLEGGQQVVCTPDHRFAVHSKSTALFGESVFRPLAAIPTHHVGHTPAPEGIYAVNHVPTDVGAPWDLTTCEFVGLFAAEGTLQNNSAVIWQNPNTAGEKHRAARDVARSFAELHGLVCTDYKDGVYVSLSTRPDLQALLESCGSGAPNKRIPEVILNGNAAQMRHVLHGFILGDGHVQSLDEYLDTQFSLYTTSEGLAEDLQLVCQKLNKPVSISRRNRVGTPVVVNGVETGTANYVEIHLRYKVGSHRNTEELRGLGSVAVTQVEDAGEVEVFDLTVDQDSWYFLASAGGILAHNCGMPKNDINARYELGSRHAWRSACGCPDGCDLARTFPDCVIDDRKRGKLYLRCPKCGWTIHEPQNGRYIPENSTADYNSYHVSQLISKFISLKEIWFSYNHTTNMAEFFNAKLGLPYIDEDARGVSKEQVEACINPDLNWRRPGDKERSRTAMGIDQGGGYCMVVIADINSDGTRKRIRHVEIIESANSDYFKEGKRTGPFVRIEELMNEYNVGLCVCDMMPNYNDALSVAQKFPGRFFLAWYQKEAKDAVSWADKDRMKPTLRKAGTKLKFKYMVALSRYLSMSVALGEWAAGSVEIPVPERLVQICGDEMTGQLKPDEPARRLLDHLTRLVHQFRVTNPETGEGKDEWQYAGKDPHLAHAWNYCNVALERLRRGAIFTFA